MEVNIREEQLFIAQALEQAQCFQDMVEAMKQVVSHDACLTRIERNLLSVAYKNVVRKRREEWKALQSIGKTEKMKEPNNIKLVRQLKAKIEAQMHKYSYEIIDLIDNQLLQRSIDNIQAQIFYYKMKGDHWRYVSDCSQEKNNEAGINAEFAYEIATKKMDRWMGQRHYSLLLGLYLNRAVHQYEFKNNPAKACEIARQAFSILQDFERMQEDQYKEITTILQLLRDNLSLWGAQLQQREYK